jgi:hypothetical protein
MADELKKAVDALDAPAPAKPEDCPPKAQPDEAHSNKQPAPQPARRKPELARGE